MLGLGLAITVGKRILGDAIDSLLSALKGRATYYENGSASKSTIKAIDNADVLDKASILLTPTATSDARVHSVKTYTGDELVTNGAFDTDSDWASTPSSGWSISNGKARRSGHSTNSDIRQDIAVVNGGLYKFSYTRSYESGDGQTNLYLQLDNANYSTLGVYDSTVVEEHTVEGYFTTTFTGDLTYRIYGIGDFTGTIDNVSVVDVSSDFDFDRASSATRINSSGLVQDMQSITDPELVLNGDFEELGDEEVTDGDFPNLDNWSVNGGDYATIVDGALNSNNTENGSWFAENISQNISFVNGKTYKVTFKAKNISGALNLRITHQSHVVFSNNLTSSFVDYTVYYTAQANNDSIRIFCNDAIGEFQIDNLSVKEVPHWNLGTGWSIEDGKASFDGGSDANIIQTSSDIIIGNTFKITLDVSDMDNGELSVRLGGGAATEIARIEDNGPYVFYGVSISSNITFRALSSFDGSIDNISVKDITFSTDVDLARINYDSNGENGHILLEPTSTNLITYSEDFTQWTKSNADNINVIATTIISPDGVSFANKLYPISTSSSSYITQNAAAECFSIFVKKGERRWILIYGGFANSNVWFDSENGVLGTVKAEATATVESFSNDWYRIKIIWTQNSTQVRLYNTDDDNTLVSTANNTDGLYIWGAQLEELPYATSYIPTLTGSTVTRATETANGAGSADLINSTEGVLYAEIAALANDGTFRQLTISDSSTSDRISIDFTSTSNQIRSFCSSGGSTVANMIGTVTDVKQFNKVAVKYKLNDYALWINGVEVDTDTSASAPIGLKELAFDNSVGSNNFKGKVKAVAVFNEALSDAELNNLTG